MSKTRRKILCLREGSHFAPQNKEKNSLPAWGGHFAPQNKENCMDLPKDPIMLYSVINLKLRDYYSNLDALCEDLDVDKEELVKKLGAVGFEYNKETNQFM